MKYIVLLLVAIQCAHAQDFLRVDFGQYSAEKFRMGTTETNYKDMTNGTDSANTTTVYTRVTADLSLSEKHTLSLAAEYTHSSMNGFTAATNNDGDVVAGINAISLTSTRTILDPYQDSMGWDWSIGVSAPGDTTINPQQFIATTDGVTRYILGTSVQKTISPLVSAHLSLGYALRPGRYEYGTDQSVDIPDRLTIDLSFPFYVGEMIIGPTYSQQQSFGGIDIGDDTWSEIGTPAFPVTKEEHSSIGLYLGKAYGSYWTDLSINSKTAVRNTDTGVTVNIGVQRALDM